MAVVTLGHLLALQVTPANVGDQEATGDAVNLAYVDQVYAGETAAEAAAAEKNKLEVVNVDGGRNPRKSAMHEKVARNCHQILRRPLLQSDDVLDLGHTLRIGGNIQPHVSAASSPLNHVTRQTLAV